MQNKSSKMLISCLVYFFLTFTASLSHYKKSIFQDLIHTSQIIYVNQIFFFLGYQEAELVNYLVSSSSLISVVKRTLQIP